MSTRTRSSLFVGSLHTCHGSRSSEIICDTWTIAVYPPDENQTLGPRGFYFASSTAWNALPAHVPDPDLSLNSFKTKFLDILTWVTLILLFLFSVRANAIVYKLAHANVCIKLNWILSPSFRYKSFVYKINKISSYRCQFLACIGYPSPAPPLPRHLSNTRMKRRCCVAGRRSNLSTVLQPFS